MRKRLLLLTGVAVALLAAPTVASAATITVSTTDDVNAAQCTLRDAITAANTDTLTGGCVKGSGADVINFNLPSPPPNTITLGTALPPITASVDIQGPGAGALTVSGNDAVRVFRVNNFVGAASISGLTIAHGLCTAACTGGDVGGGVYNAGTLTLDHVVVDHNTASNTSGGMNAFPEGGGILNQKTLTLTLSTVSNNTASAANATSQNAPQGGGIYSNSGTVTLDRSTVSGNAATAVAGAGSTTNARGGGIANFANLTIERSTLNGNQVSASGSTLGNSAAGGGISNTNSAAVNVTIDRSTVTANTVTASGASLDAQSGGFNVFGTTFSVTSSTITGNSAPIGANVSSSPVAMFKNTIVSNPLGGGANCTGTATSQGYNVISTTGCGFTLATDVTNADPMLAPLADNGGPTQTMALQAGSPAIDKGLSSGGEAVDQRGQTRPSDFGAIPNSAGGNGADIGAFELQDTTPPDTSITSGPAAGSSTNNSTPSFGFSATEVGSTFECATDGAAFSPCASPHVVGPLADGPHSFAVRAVDAAHNPDPTPATRTFTVDATPPDTAITSGPAAGSFINDPTPAFGFTASESPASFQCAVDGGAFASCSSPDTLATLADGQHSFAVRASDAVGNLDPAPASRSFTVDTQAPQTKIKGLKKTTTHRKLKIKFGSSQPGSTFKCKLDKKRFKPCTSPYRTKRLALGRHKFAVVATDRAGNVDPTAAKKKFQVVVRSVK